MASKANAKECYDAMPFTVKVEKDSVYRYILGRSDRSSGLMEDIDMNLVSGIIEEFNKNEQDVLNIDEFNDFLARTRSDTRNAQARAAERSKKGLPGNIPGDPFGEFVPFEENEILKLPAFPIDSLPDAVASCVRAVSESVQVSPDMAACQALGVLALCCQGLFEINIKPDWTESVNLFLLEMARPSERKSPTLKQMVQPIYDYMQKYNEDNADEIAASESRIRILKKQIEAIEKNLGSLKGARSGKV